MVFNTILIGLALIVTGGIGYYLSSFKSVTALIPAFFGIAMVLGGLIARNQEVRRKAIFLVALIALFGLIGASMRLPKSFGAFLNGGSVMAFIFQSVMAVLCFFQLYLSIRSLVSKKHQA